MLGLRTMAWLLSLLSCLLLTRPLRAQSADGWGDERALSAAVRKPAPAAFQVHLGVSTLVAAPLGGMRNAHPGYGLGFLVGACWKKLPASFGFDVVASWWGSSTTRFLLDPTDRATSVDLTRSTHAIYFDLWLRLQPRTWRVQPFLEGSAGLRQVNAEYDLSFTHGTGTTSTQKVQSWTPNLGLGAGVDVELARADDDSGRVYVSLGLRWLHGGRAALRNLDDPSASGHDVNVRVSSNSTLFMLGILIRGDAVPVPDPP